MAAMIARISVTNPPEALTGQGGGVGDKAMGDEISVLDATRVGMAEGRVNGSIIQGRDDGDGCLGDGGILRKVIAYLQVTVSPVFTRCAAHRIDKSE